ncbi:hypothetical protein [Rubinisphaera sp.]|uniref:hypothetical protein n=1 Tax=Rubinisphaera sp. TaxID=2024857 RepID=UPI000C0FD4B2|nr:hypothetical protein [Rubinisphaera sp.]MBV11919.1 hypothetical protein [Rubinisphaera sp.]HCS51526.1 hypothetical protein [Planctomycetaceae bacterium]|tara:strand:+ start:4762 stop:5235 length:474 start_codon:yes stop_codon:yes gene_type:complete
MNEEQNPSQSTADSGPISGTSRRRSIAGTWIVYYLIAFLLLAFTMPLTSHSNNWSGIFPAFGILMFGAHRLKNAGATNSIIFIFGCSTSFLFAFRFISMGRFHLWLQYQAPSMSVLLAIWCTICLALGASAVGIANVVSHENEPAGPSDSQKVKEAS